MGRERPTQGSSLAPIYRFPTATRSRNVSRRDLAGSFHPTPAERHFRRRRSAAGWKSPAKGGVEDDHCICGGLSFIGLTGPEARTRRLTRDRSFSMVVIYRVRAHPQPPDWWTPPAKYHENATSNNSRKCPHPTRGVFLDRWPVSVTDWLNQGE